MKTKNFIFATVLVLLALKIREGMRVWSSDKNKKEDERSLVDEYEGIKAFIGEDMVNGLVSKITWIMFVFKLGFNLIVFSYFKMPIVTIVAALKIVQDLLKAAYFLPKEHEALKEGISNPGIDRAQTVNHLVDVAYLIFLFLMLMNN